MHDFIQLKRDYLSETSLKANEMTDKGKDHKETSTLNKDMKLLSCLKLALRAS